MRLLVVAGLALLAVAGTADGGTTPVRASMTTSSTEPLADTPWRYTIVVKDRAGRSLAAKVRLQTLLGTLVVGCWKRKTIVPCSGADAGAWVPFRGKRTGLVTWPSQSAGMKLTFQATVVAAGQSLRLRAPVTVRLP